ncbi:hypothetical protein EDC96DRAFT_519248 [Choanephora cucurbitarum]|nr:hypothetical protein EDC96DRAFT_519248 [Choanephora cucurbitarum]
MVIRHARILSQFISNISPIVSSPLLTRKGVTTCIGCGRFQLQPVFFRPLYTTPTATTTISKNKYAKLPSRARPAEPSITIMKYVKQGRLNEALSTYYRLFSEGSFPSRESFYQLAYSLYRCSDLQGMYAIHDTLIAHFRRQRRVSKANKRTLLYVNTMLINLISKSNTVDIQRIMALCKELVRYQQRTQSPIVLYNTLIKVMLEQKQVTYAHALLNDIAQHNLQPTFHTYGILLKDAAKQKDLPRLMSYLDQIEQHPDLYIDYATVSIVVGALCQLRSFDHAVKVVKSIRLPKTRDEMSSPKYTLELLGWIEHERQKYTRLKRKKRKLFFKRKRMYKRKIAT